jgi:hypothetical protein
MSSVRSHNSEIVGDFVTVRPHPTVVRFEQLEGVDAGWISESYYATAEVQGYLDLVCRLIQQRQGQGIFLIGHYGSGKSHFLSYLVQGVRNGRLVGESAPQVVTVSLLNYSAENRLEQILSEAVGVSLSGGDRRPGWQHCLAQHADGLLLVVDELSEFLRSKSSPQAFNEDVRFLQFLGEWTRGEGEQPLWVVAAMQEGIEHTGVLESSLYRKIKDRYPLRMILSTAHVRELVGASILVKGERYDSGVKQLLERLQGLYPRSEVDLTALAEICPLHPATLELLEAVRDRFSQARGIIDFVVTQLGGNEERAIPPFLQQPWGALITPDRIIDHFRDLFEVQPEFLPLAQRLFPWYQKEIENLFPREAQQQLAWRLLKLLVVAWMAPGRKGVTASEAAAWLLLSVSTTDPQKNSAVVEKILQRLAQAGRYVQCSGARYVLALEEEGGAALERLLQHELGQLEGSEESQLERLALLLGSALFNPFQLPREQWQPRSLRWHFHPRSYSVWFGSGDPEGGKGRADGVALVVRLPWGEITPLTGYPTLLPKPLALTEELRQLVAMVQLQQRPLTDEVEQRLQGRIRERLPLFQSLLTQSYRDAVLVGRQGERFTPSPAPFDPPLSRWLDHYATWLLRHTYPAFEKFAPQHGPLPKESYRRLMRHALESDLGAAEAGDEVRLIREAYLLPMKLMRRQGRSYQTLPNLERNELVSLLLPLLEHAPAPQRIYHHLAEPIYGLVPDQVSLLLIFLNLQGVVEINKEGVSWQACFETLPNPIQYDEVVAGGGLDASQTRMLERLCEGLGVHLPAQWSVLTQRKAVRQLREVLRGRLEPLHSVAERLREKQQGERLVAEIQQLQQQSRALVEGEPLQALQQFLYEVGSVDPFLQHLQQWQGLPERFERLLSGQQRLSYLLHHPVVTAFPDDALQLELEQIPAAPDLDQPEPLEHWLQQAENGYRNYQKQYRALHQQWWSRCGEHAIWGWRPPRVIHSRHLGVGEQLREIALCLEEAKRLRCNRESDLAFQPLCNCGFDGYQAPISEVLHRFEQLRREAEQEMQHFFARHSVRQQLQQWQQQGLEVSEGTAAYLRGEAVVPDVEDVTRLDRHLSGVALVRELDPLALLEPLGGRNWERSELLAALERQLSRYGDQRLRLQSASVAAVEGDRDSERQLASWCLQQALQQAIPLPDAVGKKAVAAAAEDILPQWVGGQTVARFDRLNLGAVVEDRLLELLLDGQLAAPTGEWRGRLAPPLAAAMALLESQQPTDAESLGAEAALLYRQHQRIYPLARERWLEWLDRLAHSPLEGASTLVDTLQSLPAAQWLLIDALGVPLLGALRDRLATLLPGWQVQQLQFALVQQQSTTQRCYGELVAAGINHPLDKINVVDQLLHQRPLSFGDLEKLMLTELEIALRPIRERLNPEQPLLIFADHGFRLGADGTCYEHGGSSTLERLVPLLTLRYSAQHRKFSVSASETGDAQR